MNRRQLTVNQPRSPSRRRSTFHPTCPSIRPGTSQKCVLDPGHRNDHFADGRNWPNEAAA